MTYCQRFWASCTAQNVFTFVIAWATVAIFVTAYYQWQTLAKQTSDAENIQRAFVYLAGFQQLEFRAKDKTLIKVQFLPQFRNSGNTPTKHAFSWSNGFPSSTTMDNDYSYPDLDTNGHAIAHPCHKWTFPPQDVVLGHPNEMDMATIVGVQNQTRHFYLYGWVAYNDVFEQHAKPHLTRYCSEVIAVYGTEPGQVSSSEWGPCPNERNNCIDDECEDPNPPQCGP